MGETANLDNKQTAPPAEQQQRDTNSSQNIAQVPEPVGVAPKDKIEESPVRSSSDVIIACWTRILGLSTILLFFATAAMGFILYRTDERIGEQVEGLHRQLALMENDQRPWIKVEAEAFGDFFFPESGSMRLAHTPIKYFVVNTGKEPAFNVEIQPFAFVVGDEHTDIMGSQIKWCENVKNQRHPEQSLLIFPGEKLPWEFGGGVIGTAPHPEEIKKYARTIDGKVVINFWIFGCVTYDFGRPDTVHQTAFAWQIARLIKRPGMADAFTYDFDLAERVPKELILLQQWNRASGVTN